MHLHTTRRALAPRLRRTAALSAFAALALAALPVGGCSPDEILSIQDPDIINPSDVQSAAGANAVRVGALGRLNTATTGGESLLLLGGLFADEWINGDSFIYRQQIDKRAVTPENDFLTTANRALHRARVSAIQAIDLLEEFSPTAPPRHFAEMYFVQAYVENILAEHYCDGIIFSGVVDGKPVYGEPITTAATFERALGHANEGLALMEAITIPTSDTASLRVLNELRIIKGRILMNQATPGNNAKRTEAAAAVAPVPTTFRYEMLHSQTTNNNQFWNLNNNARRYSVGNNEGGNGLNFATAADPRVPVCVAGPGCGAPDTIPRRDDLATPLHVQRLWPARDSRIPLLIGAEARLIQAEALLATDPAGALAILNQLRTTVTGLAPLPLEATPAAQVNQLFRERAFWLFGRGTRTGDLRRLIRQYGRTEDSVFPTGDWHKGGPYGDDVNVPVPQAEQNNPNVPQGQVCLNRAA
jgi:starch-binding outer membrane protein, SusD/RagB family